MMMLLLVLQLPLLIMMMIIFLIIIHLYSAFSTRFKGPVYKKLDRTKK